MSRPSVNLALLGLGEHEQRVLVSAVSALAGPTLLPAEVRWSSADEADVVIVAVDRPDAMRSLAELQLVRPREQVRYADLPRADADIARPLRIQQLLQALQRAIQQALEHARALPVPVGSVGVRQYYRGAEIRTSEARDEVPAMAESASPGKRMYRGRAY